jgi:single-stranded-DNA-specific exonuclease
MHAPSRWLLPPDCAEPAGALARALSISPPAARVLFRRGYGDPAAARAFLHPSLDDLYDPFLMLGLREALARLRHAIAAGEKILLYGDYDVDGTTSVVILTKAIELAGGRAAFHIPNRLRDGYGMRDEVIDQAAAEGVRLIVSLDTGIRASPSVCRARSLGIDVIVTDHHLPDQCLPPAFAILNPKQPGCSYPEKDLCGAGVAFKLVQALLASLGWPEARLRRMIDSFLKIVALATVADVVPLTGENRVIVKHGLANFASVRNPGLRALLRVAGFSDGEVPTAGQVAFRIAPRLNAAGRMANAADIVHLLLTGEEEEAARLAERLHSLNRERQQAETGIVRRVLDECLKTPVTDDQHALVFAGRDWHRGVVGIVASRLVERFHRPVFVLSEDTEQGVLQGSARSIPAFHLLSALESMPELFLRFGGHRQAAGLTLARERLEEFKCRISSYAAGCLTPADFVEEIEIDSFLDFQEIGGGSIGDLLALAPFGAGNPPPVLAARGVEVMGSPAVWRDRHLLLNLRQNSRTVLVKAWQWAERVGEFPPGARLDVALSFESDDYRGVPGWSVILRDAKPA